MNQDLLQKILESNLSVEFKEKVLSYWLLPAEGDTKAPIKKALDSGRVGAVRRPTKEKLDLKNNPLKKEEIEEMEETLDEVTRSGASES